jgi:hypothetical protein
MKIFTEQQKLRIKTLFEEAAPISVIRSELRVSEKRILFALRGMGLSPAKRKRERPPRGKPSDSLKGQKFAHLTIEGFQHEDRCWKYLLRCDCGNVSFERSLPKLQKGRRLTCGKVGCEYFHAIKKKNGRSFKFTGHEDIYGSRWSLWRISAEKRGLKFSITPKYAWTIFEQQKRACALSGQPIQFGNAWNKSCSASLDRIDSSKGYIRGNIQWLHKDVNIMKRELSDEQFINICQQVVTHRKATDKRSVS